ncbi:hypothetical protein ABEB36_010524 [Hypothenemus hampei]|uniref:Peptidase S1 domain-containing protein n=1 Tax=Hypothenemus hampei TaxID=57062 RepID=A0ABD1EK17_HYPHA
MFLLLTISVFHLFSLCLSQNAGIVIDRPEIYVPEAVVPQLDGRIVGGWPVNISSHPHQLSFQNWHRHSCGASILSSYWVVTAAHCVSGAYLRYTIRAGTHLWAESEILLSPSLIIRHPQYNSTTLDYDIALVRLSSPQPEIEGRVRYARLPPEGWSPEPGATATVTGWGTPVSGGSLMDDLQEVTVPIVSNMSCEEYYREWLATRAYEVTDRMICAGFVGGGRDACQGDSGGPLIVNDYLTGVVSWGNGCAFAGFPGLYASVPNLLPWIKQHTGL